MAICLNIFILCSFKVGARLCHKIGKLRALQGVTGQKRYFLWAPINQYVPLLRKAFPIRPPIFAPECLKFVLMHCRKKFFYFIFLITLLQSLAHNFYKTYYSYRRRHKTSFAQTLYILGANANKTTRMRF